LARIELVPDSVIGRAVTVYRLVNGEIGTGFEAGVELFLQFGGVRTGHDAALVCGVSVQSV
jgi:hypothetical protein